MLESQGVGDMRNGGKGGLKDTLLSCKIEATAKWDRVSTRCKIKIRKEKEKRKKGQKQDIDFECLSGVTF